VTTALSQKFIDVARGASTILNRLGLDEAIEYTMRASEMEQFYSTGIRLITGKNDLSRIPMLRTIIQEAYRNPSVMNLMTVVLDDQRLICGLLGQLDQIGAARQFANPAGVSFTMNRKSIGYIFDNYHIGMKRGDPAVFKRYVSNVHLPAQLFRDPDLLIGEVYRSLGITKSALKLTVELEGASVTVSKISDMTAWIEDVPPFSIQFGGNTIPLHIPDLKVPVSFDSKVVKGSSGILRAFNQQLDLVLSDRLERIVKPILTSLNQSSQLNNLTLTKAKRKALEKYVPYVFQHYVFTTSDFVRRNWLTDAMDTAVQAELNGRIAHLMHDYSAKDAEILSEVLGDWLYAFVSSGDFIMTQSSDLTYR